MPSSLTIDDFKPFSVTCELRYENAYLIYDRTGQVIEDVRESFTDINVSTTSPQQTSWTTNEGTLTLELGACRFISTRPDKNAEAFAKYCKAFFDAVTHHLQIGVFTRIGLRYILRKEYKTVDEAKSALASMTLANLKPTKRFNSSDSPTEVLLRWEDSQIGAFVRLKAETVEIKATVPPELLDIVPKFEKKMNGLTLDIDYYTVAPVDREQWNSQEWVAQKLRIIRKEVDGIMEGGK
jgi:uncharacterized protein (TIGR04255 family)